MTSQVFASEGLNDAFKAALANSEQDHVKQQVAFDVSPDQVEKATFKKVTRPEVVSVPASLKIDMPFDTTEPNPKKAIKSSDDLAAVAKELSDIQ